MSTLHSNAKRIEPATSGTRSRAKDIPWEIIENPNTKSDIRSGLLRNGVVITARKDSI